MKRIFSAIIMSQAAVIMMAEKGTSAAKEVALVTTESHFWTAGAIVAIAVAIVACSLGVWMFLKFAVFSKELDLLKKAVKNNIKKTSSTLEANHKEDILRLERQLADMKDQLASFAAKAEMPASRPVQRSQETSYPKEELVKHPEPVPEPRKTVLYFGPARSSKFSGGRGVFTPGQSLYEITYIGGNLAEFRFCDRREALSVALRSMTDYIESACVVEGNPSSNPSKVITIEPGRLRRDGNEWLIEKKARINLV